MSSTAAYTLLGLTAIVAGLMGILAFAVLKFLAAAKDARGHGASGGDRTAAVADALASAVAHAHVEPGVTAQARAATAFRLGVAERTRALQAEIDAHLGPAEELRRLREAAASLGELARRHEPPPAPVDLKTVIDVAVSGSRIAARARGGDLVVQGQFATVAGQSDAVDYTLTALVSAALDSCQRAGIAPVVAIRGERDETARRVRVFVDDNGPGDSPPPERGVIADAIARLGGRVSESQSPMGGAQICLDLPIAPAA